MNSKVKNGICIFISMIFLIFAALQYNDPDPTVWISAYMLISCLSLIQIYKILSPYIHLGVITTYTAFAIYLWPETYMGVTMPMSYRIEIELARESLGLGIAVLAVLILAGISLLETRTYHKKQTAGSAGK